MEAGRSLEGGFDPGDLCEHSELIAGAFGQVPAMSDRQRTELACCVMDLLDEIRDYTLPGLRNHGLTQMAADLERHENEIWNALDPLLQDGPNVLYRTLGLEREDEESE